MTRFALSRQSIVTHGIEQLRNCTETPEIAQTSYGIAQRRMAMEGQGEAPQSKEELGMARRRKLKKYEVAKILYVYDEGSATLDEIYERTGYTRDQVAQVLPVEEIEKREMMDVFKKYGY